MAAKSKSPKTPRPKAPRKKKTRFSIGEWYGRLFTSLTAKERLEYAEMQDTHPDKRKAMPCPFKRSTPGQEPTCSKEGGGCSLRLYQEGEGGLAETVEGATGELRASCPYRFHEGLDAFLWAGENILEDPKAIMVPEVGFLESSKTTDSEGGDDVGRIDMVVVQRGETGPAMPLHWCALEVQGVYFSGNKMELEFRAIVKAKGALIFPAATRRPDYRSSGPKRLMPQLQIKVPTLRRWGKKMAVVVDRSFFDSMGAMVRIDDLSLCDIAWFIVRFEEVPGKGRAKLVRDEAYYTTLEQAVDGLTGGKPLTKPQFESRIKDKILKVGG